MSQQKHEISWHEGELPYSEQFEDHYYSCHDGRAECAHVFLRGNGLPERWSGANQFTIGELGFGTGLNFLETWATWKSERKEGQHLTFVSVEAFPLDVENAQRALGQWPGLKPFATELLNNWPFLFQKNNPPIEMDAQTTLQLMHGRVEDVLPGFPATEAWFLDGFSPSKNPDMWCESLMKMIAEKTVPGGTCASYTAAGWVRRNLEAAGFKIDKCPGFGSKRHMITGTKT